MGSDALAANFEYRYPITWGLDAALFSGIGNTWNDMSDWNIAANYLNYGVALKLGENRVSSFEGVLAWGSNRMDEPVFVPFDQFRLAIGVNRGF
jgi:hypothetical protein